MADNSKTSKSGRSKSMSTDLVSLTKEFKRKIAVLGTISDHDFGGSDVSSECGGVGFISKTEPDDDSYSGSFPSRAALHNVPLLETHSKQNTLRVPRGFSKRRGSCSDIRISPLAISDLSSIKHSTNATGNSSQWLEFEGQRQHESTDSSPVRDNMTDQPAFGMNRKRRNSLPVITHTLLKHTDEPKFASNALLDSRPVNKSDKDLRRIRDGPQMVTIQEGLNYEAKEQTTTPSIQDVPRPNFRCKRRSSVGECNFFPGCTDNSMRKTTGSKLPAKWFEFLESMEHKAPEVDESRQTPDIGTNSPSFPSSPRLPQRRLLHSDIDGVGGTEAKGVSSRGSSRGSTPTKEFPIESGPEMGEYVGRTGVSTHSGRRRSSVCVPLILRHECHSPALDSSSRSVSNADLAQRNLLVPSPFHSYSDVGIQRTGSENTISVSNSPRDSIGRNTKKISLDIPVPPKIKTAVPSNCENRMNMKTDYSFQLTKYLKSLEKDMPTKTLLEIKKLREQQRLGENGGYL